MTLLSRLRRQSPTSDSHTRIGSYCTSTAFERPLGRVSPIKEPGSTYREYPLPRFLRLVQVPAVGASTVTCPVFSSRLVSPCCTTTFSHTSKGNRSARSTRPF